MKPVRGRWTTLPDTLLTIAVALGAIAGLVVLVMAVK